MASRKRMRIPSPIILALIGVGAGSAALAMDGVRAVTRTDEAVEAFGVTGAGVTIAILDRGIDWTHPAPGARTPDIPPTSMATATSAQAT